MTRKSQQKKRRSLTFNQLTTTKNESSVGLSHINLSNHPLIYLKLIPIRELAGETCTAHQTITGTELMTSLF